MRHDSVEYIWVPILGPKDWNINASQVDVSIDDGQTWHTAVTDNTTAVTVTLGNNVVGTRCHIRILSSALSIPVGVESITVLVRPTANPEIPVIVAGSLAIE